MRMELPADEMLFRKAASSSAAFALARIEFAPLQLKTEMDDWALGIASLRQRSKPFRKVEFSLHHGAMDRRRKKPLPHVP
jgi:hypothetical protein